MDGAAPFPLRLSAQIRSRSNNLSTSCCTDMAHGIALPPTAAAITIEHVPKHHFHPMEYGSAAAVTKLHQLSRRRLTTTARMQPAQLTRAASAETIATTKPLDAPKSLKTPLWYMRARTLPHIDKNAIEALTINNDGATFLNNGRKVAPSGRGGGATRPAIGLGSSVTGGRPKPAARKTGTRPTAIHTATGAVRALRCWTLASASLQYAAREPVSPLSLRRNRQGVPQASRSDSDAVSRGVDQTARCYIGTSRRSNQRRDRLICPRRGLCAEWTDLSVPPRSLSVRA